MESKQAMAIEGHVGSGCEAVRDTFVANFDHRHELGGACCVYHAPGSRALAIA